MSAALATQSAGTMTGFIASIGLPEITAGIIVVALNAYVLMGGADFGGGVWDLLASGPRRDRQRALIGRAIAPIWEANHVWLIVVVVMLFTAFPVAFSILGVILHLPLTIMLIGIVMRGSAFIFRSYGSRAELAQRRWGIAFAVASAVTPIVLGMIIGAISSGAVGSAADRVGVGSFVEVFVAPWVGAYQVVVGLFALALFAYLAAVYLAVAATDDGVRNDFRVRALGAAILVFVLAALALFIGRSAAPAVMEGLVTAPWSWALHVATGIAAIVALAALWRRQYAIARIAAAGQVSLILWGWAVAQYPFVIPSSMTIQSAAAPRITLMLLLYGLAGGGAILIPSLRYLFRTFKTVGE